MKSYLILANGDVYEGESFGVIKDTVGEVVFTTGMGSYMETLTDSCCYGQIVVQSFPLIGNYGAITADIENPNTHLSGYVVRELCENGSNFRKECELGEFLTERNVVGLKGIDTRKLTKLIRERGSINGMITGSLDNKSAKLETIKKFKIKNAPKNTTIKTAVSIGKGKRIALIDYGAYSNAAKEFAARGYEVTAVPCTSAAEEILKLSPVGIILSEGGGDPKSCTAEIAELKKLTAHNIPILGIGLGHQLLALAMNLKTQKLKHGHRGANQPVKDLNNGLVYITNQNHGYAVSANGICGIAAMSMINVNDKTCEGLTYINKPYISTQFYPSANSGTSNNASFIFDSFQKLIGDNNA